MGTTSGTGSIPGAPDAELGLPRPGPLGFRWTRPEGAARGLVFVIHGFGADAQADYDVKLRAHLAERFGLARKAVVIRSGAGARRKRVLLVGVPARRVREVLITTCSA